eukprot:3599877-Rhodomonas_salina.2
MASLRASINATFAVCSREAAYPQVERLPGARLAHSERAPSLEPLLRQRRGSKPDVGQASHDSRGTVEVRRARNRCYDGGRHILHNGAVRVRGCVLVDSDQRGGAAGLELRDLCPELGGRHPVRLDQEILHLLLVQRCQSDRAIVLLDRNPAVRT